MERTDLSRRQLMGGLGGLLVAGSFGFAALGTGADALAAGSQTRVRYWNLFSGGDGYNMIAMLRRVPRTVLGILVASFRSTARRRASGQATIHPQARLNPRRRD